MERSQLGTRCLNKKKAWLRTETLSIASLMPASADPGRPDSVCDRK